ncbi:MAG: hypothetical protein GX054_09990, partial [Clostridiales bacterium]|nr:hypothetical protein [Clostridiales bacterium]
MLLRKRYVVLSIVIALIFTLVMTGCQDTATQKPDNETQNSSAKDNDTQNSSAND